MYSYEREMSHRRYMNRSGTVGDVRSPLHFDRSETRAGSQITALPRVAADPLADGSRTATLVTADDGPRRSAARRIAMH